MQRACTPGSSSAQILRAHGLGIHKQREKHVHISQNLHRLDENAGPASLCPYRTIVISTCDHFSSYVRIDDH